MSRATCPVARCRAPTMRCMRAVTHNLCLALALVGCATRSSPGLEYRASYSTSYRTMAEALDKAESQWVAAGVTEYSFHIRRGGVFGGSVYNVVYRDSSCRAWPLKDIGLSSSIECEENSMPRLFAEVRKEVTSGDSSISLSLDPELGYVRWFWIEPRTDVTDQGWGAEISRFRVLK